MSIAVFAGSFDPFTAGHLDIVKRAAAHFDKLHVTVSPNPNKGKALFTWEERMQLIRDAVAGLPNVVVDGFEGLLVDHCRAVGADVLLRSVRSGADVDYERQLETVNRSIEPAIETFYIFARAEYAYISSTLVRSLMAIGVDIAPLVPDGSHPIITKKLKEIASENS